MNNISAIFETHFDAEQALNRLEAAGITEDQISMLTTDDARSHHFAFVNNTKAEEGATTGVALGGLAGAVIAGMLSAGAVAIPGLNIVVSGYLISALAGLGIGAPVGGVVGALVGLGFPENEAKLFEKELKGGNILLAVKPRNSDQKKQVQKILDETCRGKARPVDTSYRDSAGFRH